MCTNKHKGEISKHSQLWLLIILICVLVSRLSLLEYTDLIDPTETRYASVAQEMVTSGNWLTPMLPMPEGTVPYLGKPPLHFWLTSISYKLFGVDEWTSRLPSFLATLLTVLAIFSFSRFLFGPREAAISVLIFLSSVMPFFLAGASVTDVTLTMFITCSVMLFYTYIATQKQSTYLLLSSSALAALGFLSKGPISLALIGLPFFLWSILKRDFSWLKKVRWVVAISLFLVIASPWFIMSEIHNPGFLKYFFWNENIARYLFKSYGDRYGSGHVQFYGMSWLMLAGGFFPWTIAFVYVAIRSGRVKLLQLFRDNPAVLFLGIWAISTPLFFTFVRQLHAMYIFPALPPLSMLLGVMLLRDSTVIDRLSRNVLSRRFLILVAGSIVLVAAVGIGLCYSHNILLISLPIITVFAVLLSRVKLTDPTMQVFSRISLAFCAIYLTIISSLTPFIDENRSSAEVLEAIANGKECSNRNLPKQVGVFTRNTFSHYWVSRAWREELNEQVNVKYISPSNASTSDVCFYLVKAKSPDKVPSELLPSFRLLRQSGEWFVYVRTEPPPL